MKNKQQLTVWIVLIVVAVAGTLYSKFRAENKNGAEDQVTAAEEIKIPAMLELGSEGCKACEQMKPVVAKLKNDCSETIFVEYYDVRKDASMAQKYKIKLIPTQIFLRADGTEFFRHEGFFSFEEIQKVFLEEGVEI